MAFTYTDLSLLATGNGFQLWHYTTTDTAATVDTADYFANAAGVMRKGDIVLATCATGGTYDNRLFVVTARSATSVTLSDGKSLLSETVVVPFLIEATKWAAGTTIYVVAPCGGVIEKVVTTCSVSSSTASVITFSNDGTTVSGLTVTVANDSVVGTIDSGTPTAGDVTAVVVEDTDIAIIPDGNATAGEIYGLIHITPATA